MTKRRKALPPFEQWGEWALVELNLRPRDFARFTPAQFLRIHERWSRRQERLDLREELHLARLLYTIAASSGATNADKRPLLLKDFLPPAYHKYLPKKKKKKFHQPSGDELFAQFLAVTPHIKKEYESNGRT